MKKVWAVLLAAALLLALAVPVMAVDIVANGNCGDDLTWTLDSAGKLTISGTGEMWDFAPYGSKGGDIIYAPWNLYFREDNPYPNPTAVIQPGVTSVGDYAFEAPTLTSVTIPASVTRIGAASLSGAMNIQVASGNPVYSDVDGVLFSRDETVLYAYPGGRDADAYTVPDGVTRIGDAAFKCGYFFSNSLKDITIPDSVTNIGNSVFDGCSLLENILVASGNPVYSDVDGVLFSRDAKVLYYYPEGKKAETYTIPDGVTCIGDEAFYWRTSLESVMIPDSVTSIGDKAFYLCFGLTSITIPDSVTDIGVYAFSACSGLTSVAIPDSVTSIREGTFSDCQYLKTVTIPNSVTSIGNSAFSGCWNLTNITIPDSVTSIGDEAFYACGAPMGGSGGLTSVTIPKSVTHIGQGAFSSCSNLVSVYVVSGNPAYSDVDGVLFSRDASVLCCYPAGKEADAYMIPNGVISIDDEAFSGNGSLTSVTIPDSVTSIGDGAFYMCSSLTSITIPDGVTRIGDDTFVMCSNLTSVTIPDSVTSIGDSAFSSCDNLKSITIPDSVASIGDSAFSGCRSLTSVSIPDGVTRIGDSAFSGCSSLTSVSIPASVTSIGDYAFYLYEYQESSLTDVYYGGTQEQWDAVSIAAGNDPLLNATIHFADPAPAHTHTLTHYSARPADCTQDGNVEYWACDDCGTYYADAEALRPLSADELSLPALGHDWGEWQRVKEPTETAYGRKTRTCARCGATESVLIQMLPSVTPVTPTQPPQPSPEPHAFADVPESEWYVEAVNFVWDKGLMQGVSETEFAPDATADRAMLVTILHRMAEEPEAAAAAFADVDADAWFAAAVAWASETGVVSGYEDGLFHPNQPITREQLVTMLWRMAGKPEADPLETGAADWAAEAMSWAIGRGVILGDGSGYSPRRTATRAELAAILMRCDQL